MIESVKSTRILIDKLFSLQWCRDNIVIPIKTEPSLPPAKTKLIIAIGNINYLATIGDTIKKRTESYECQYVEKNPEEIQELLNYASEERIISGEGLETFEYSDDSILESLKDDSGGQSDESDFLFDFQDLEEHEIEAEDLDLSQEMLGSKIQQAAAKILIGACRSNVSDIHVEPRQNEHKIRVRRDGVMQNFVSMPRSAGIRLTACLKNMAKMDTAERRASQDGKIRRSFENQLMEFRCSTAPGKHGEKMVLRILNSDTNMLDLDTLLSHEEIRKNFRSIINQANGIVIVSGPTGSGKSTTLASALQEKDNGELNIVTAEDPIEYDLGGNIQQFQVLRAKGQTFSQLLRTFLRQDPDIILIGETRDPETAESSMDAAETGHLVFTTLHANSAASSLTRLIDMEVPAYKLIASLRGILAQRLIRKVCPECSTQRPANENEARFAGIRQGTTLRHANVLSGEERQRRKEERTLCSRCDGTGYRGRVGTYELLQVTKPIQNAIKEGKSSDEIEEIAIDQNNMLSLKAYAIELVLKELTTLSEVRKICNTQE
tara:strand:- start:2457 stop:4103 length:1647 start_codon:yes stop_codon:yes gene_type:complete